MARTSRAPAEDVGEAQDVVDLVGIVRASRGDDHVIADGIGVFRRDFRIRVGHGEDDGVRAHRFHHVLRQCALCRKAEEDIRIHHGVREAARVGLRGVRRLPLVHALAATLVDDALGIAQQDVLGRKADRLDQIETGDAGRTRTIHHELGLLDVPTGQLQCVQHAGGGDNGRAMLVIVKHGNVHQLLQALLDDEAFGRLDIFQVDPPKDGPR